VVQQKVCNKFSSREKEKSVSAFIEIYMDDHKKNSTHNFECDEGDKKVIQFIVLMPALYPLCTYQDQHCIERTKNNVKKNQFIYKHFQADVGRSIFVML